MTSQSKVLAVAVAAGLSMFASIGSASTTGTSIGVQFGVGGTHGIGAGLNPGDVAGVVPTANWNVASGDANSAGIPVNQDVNGTASLATGVTVSWFSGDTWNNGGTANFQNPPDPNATNDNLLNNGYLDGESGGHGTVTFKGLTGSAYDVYITSTGGTAEVKGGGMIVNGVDDFTKPAGTDTSGGYVRALPGTSTTPGTNGGNYHLFSGVVPVGGTISIATDGNNGRIPINSVELVAVPEPASLSVLGLGALGLLARRRRA